MTGVCGTGDGPGVPGVPGVPGATGKLELLIFKGVMRGFSFVFSSTRGVSLSEELELEDSGWMTILLFLTPEPRVLTVFLSLLLICVLAAVAAAAALALERVFLAGLMVSSHSLALFPFLVSVLALKHQQ